MVMVMITKTEKLGIVNYSMVLKIGRYDMSIVYRILLCIKEGKNNITEIVRCGNFSASTVERYIETIKSKGFIEEESGRERKFRLTKKAEDFIFLYTRLAVLWGEA